VGTRVSATVVVIAALLAAGCATSPPFPSEPRPGTLFHQYREPSGPGPFPAVVLLHTCAGVRGHLSQWATRLADAGYASLIVDSFTPRGGGACNIPSYFPATLDQVVDDAFAALAHLRTRPTIDPRRVGVMGFSYGASAALRTSSALYRRRGGFQAAVAFYPLCVAWRASLPAEAQARSNNLLDDIEVPTLILMGEADNDTPNVAANCAHAVERLRRARRPIAITLYPGAGHVFDVYDADATRAATAAMLEFFGRYLGGDGRRA
jgi:dienelactone hydrolase